MTLSADDNSISFDCVISYAREDLVFVDELRLALQDHNYNVFVDRYNLKGGSKFRIEIEDAIDIAHSVIFILSPDFLASKPCNDELNHAIKQNKRLIPVLHRDVVDYHIPVPIALSELNWIFYRNIDDHTIATNSIFQALETNIEWVKIHTWLLRRALDWTRSNKSSSELLRKDILKSMQEKLAINKDSEPQITPLQNKYIDASIERQRNSFYGVTAIILSIFLILSILLTRLWIQWNNTNTETANNFATIAASYAAEKKILQSIALLSEAAKYRSTSLVESNKFKLIQPVIKPGKTIYIPQNLLIDLVWSPSGKYVVGRELYSMDSLRIIDIDKSSVEQLGVSNFEESIGIDFAAKEDKIIWSNRNGVIHYSDLNSGHDISVNNIGEDIHFLQFSNSGDQVVFANSNSLRSLSLTDSSISDHINAPLNRVSSSQNGKVVFFSTYSGTLFLFDMDKVTVEKKILLSDLKGSDKKQLSGYHATGVLDSDGSHLALWFEDPGIRQNRIYVYKTNKDIADSSFSLLGEIALNSSTPSPHDAFFTANSNYFALRDHQSLSTYDFKNDRLHTSIPNLIYDNPLAFSITNQFLAYGTDDGYIEIYDLLSAQLIERIYAHSNAIKGLVFSQNEQRLASTGDDETFRIWDIDLTSLMNTIRPAPRFLSVDYSGELIATVSSFDRNYYVQSFKPQPGQKDNFTLPFTRISSLSLDPFNKVIYSATHGGEIIALDLNSSKDLNTSFAILGRHNHSISTISTMTDHKSIVYGVRNIDSVFVRSVIDTTKYWTFGGFEGSPEKISLSNDSKLIAVKTSFDSLYVYNSKTNSLQTFPEATCIDHISFGSNTELHGICNESSDTFLYTYDIMSGNMSFQKLDLQIISSASSFSPSGRFFVYTVKGKNGLHTNIGLLNLDDGSQITIENENNLTNEQDWIRALAFSQNSEVLYSLTQYGVLQKWGGVLTDNLEETEKITGLRVIKDSDTPTFVHIYK